MTPGPPEPGTVQVDQARGTVRVWLADGVLVLPLGVTLEVLALLAAPDMV